MALGQFKIDQPQRVFAVVEQDQPRRPKGGDLTRQLAADGAAGAGDDAPAGPGSAAPCPRGRAAPAGGSAGPRSPSAAVRAGARGPASARRGRARSAAAHGGSACRSRSACSTSTPATGPDRSGVATTSVSGSRPVRRQPFQHRGGIPDRAKERVTMDAPAGLAASRPPAAPRPAAPAADPGPARAGTGRCPRPPRPRAPTGRRHSSAAGQATARAMAPAAIDHPRRPEQHQQGQCIARPERPDCADAAPVSAAARSEQGGATAALDQATASRSSIPAKRQYCHGSRNGSPASSSVAAPASGSHNGCSQSLDGVGHRPGERHGERRQGSVDCDIQRANSH